MYLDYTYLMKHKNFFLYTWSSFYIQMIIINNNKYNVKIILTILKNVLIMLNTK